MITDNLELWNAVEKTDPAHTKNANVRGNKITAIAPQYQIKCATEKFGPYGKSWGFSNIELEYLQEKGLAVFKGDFFYPRSFKDVVEDHDIISVARFQIISSIGLYRDNAQTKIDDDFAKKLETDALTKALSKLGFNADVFMGKFDDSRYVAQMEEEFSDVKPADAIDSLEMASDLETLQKVWTDLPAPLKKRQDIIKTKDSQKEKLTNK